MPDTTEYLKNGKLHRHFNDMLHVMQPWPRPRSWVKTASTGWRTDEAQANRSLNKWLQVDMEPPATTTPAPIKVPPIPDDPAITTVLEIFGGKIETPERDTIMLTNERKHAHWVHQHHIYSLLQMIPRDVRRIVASFHNRRWQVLNLLANCPESGELYASNPAMCYLLTCSGRFRHAGLSETMRPARLLVRLPQRKVLAWLGFPPTESSRRVLAKIDPMSLSIQALLKVRDALHDSGACKLLGHQRRINSSIIWLVSDPITLLHVTPRLLTEVGNEPDQVSQPRIHGMMRDTLRMADQLGDDTVPVRYYSISRLRDVHDQLSRRIDDVVDDRLGFKWEWTRMPRKFPPPPLKGTADIVPITTVIDLVKEGRDMHHCVGAYSWMVANGETYIYRASKPIRATVAISRNSRRWVLQEVSGICNSIPSSADIESIRMSLFGCDP